MQRVPCTGCNSDVRSFTNSPASLQAGAKRSELQGDAHKHCHIFFADKSSKHPGCGFRGQYGLTVFKPPPQAANLLFSRMHPCRCLCISQGYSLPLVNALSRGRNIERLSRALTLTAP